MLATDLDRGLDRELVKLARAEAELDRQLGIGLAAVWDRKLYRQLGHARATDFVREHLGIEESRARWLARLGRHLCAVPELDRALAQRRLDASQVIELGRILKEETPAEERVAWIERGARLTVRDLKRSVQAEVRRRKETGEPAAEEPPPNPDEPPPPGGWIAIPAPARAAVLWLGALDLARMVAGRHLTQSQVGEFAFAEYFSACGTDGARLLRRSSALPVPPATTSAASLLTPELIAALNAKCSPPSSDPVPANKQAVETPVVLLPPRPTEDVEPDSSIAEIEDTWELGHELVRIAEQKKRLRYELGGLLSQFVDKAGAGALGYAGFERYCLDRLGFGLRRAELLIHFRAGLDRFPVLAAAHLAGEISYTAALLLLPILHATTEEVWVTWAKHLSYREVERVTEYARTFALPETNPIVLESWLKGLDEQGLVTRVAEANAFAAPTAVSEGTEANAFPDSPAVPLGCALPPAKDGGFPRIVGFPEDLALAPPEHCVALIRFWLPQDALDAAHRTLDECRKRMKDPLAPTWSVFEIILVHFIQTHNTPEAREINRRHPIVDRDGFWCRVSGCMSREHLEAHHMVFRSDCGCDCPCNQAGLCWFHHRPGVHLGYIKVGGFAPDEIIVMLGIHPKTGQPFACYLNERKISVEEAKQRLAEWRRLSREHLEETLPIALTA